MYKQLKNRFTLFFLTAILIIVASCTNNTAQQTPPSNPPVQQAAESTKTQQTTTNSSNGATINVIAKEMEFKLSSETAPAGLVEFVVNNQGRIPHEMEVIRIDKPVDALPLKSDGRLDSDKAGKEIGEIEPDDLKSSATSTLRLNLTPGNYLLVCNLPGHYKAGMKTLFTVK